MGGEQKLTQPFLFHPHPTLQYNEFLSTLASNAVSIGTKQRVMQGAVSTCLSVNLSVQGKEVPSLMDSGSMVTLIWEGYFKKNILPILKSLLGNSVSSLIIQTVSCQQWCDASLEVF